jgi:hypothetical protein
MRLNAQLTEPDVLIVYVQEFYNNFDLFSAVYYTSY